MLAVHACLLAWIALRHSPTWAEVFYLPAGVSHLVLARFELYRVSPPLVRTVAALPVICASPRVDWMAYDPDPLCRSEYAVGLDFFRANGSRSPRLVTLARWACIPFSVLGGYLCFRWSARLYGAAAGVLALGLWCFCPYVLGHAALMTPDAHAAAVAVAAAYTFWMWLKRPSSLRAVLAGIVLGFAELTRFTLVLFYPAWVVLWTLYRLSERQGWSQTAKTSSSLSWEGGHRFFLSMSGLPAGPVPQLQSIPEGRVGQACRGRPGRR